jgi:hypothetical protein
VIRKKKPTTSQLKDESAVNAVGDGPHPPIMLVCPRPLSAHGCRSSLQARRAGVGIETVKKGKLALQLFVFSVSSSLTRPARLTLFAACAIAVGHTQTSSGKAAHKLEAETEDFHRK